MLVTGFFKHELRTEDIQMGFANGFFSWNDSQADYIQTASGNKALCKRDAEAIGKPGQVENVNMLSEKVLNETSLSLLLLSW